MNHAFKLITFRLLLLPLFLSAGVLQAQTVPRIGFLDFVQDATVEEAHKGFMDALRDHGFSEKDSTLQVHYLNAQGDIPTLGQACDLLVSEQPDLIASNLTLSTITAVKRTATIPVFMMVSPRPDLAGLTDSLGRAPANLSGVYETLDYIDTSVTTIARLMPGITSIGTIYNQSEPQSQDAFDVLRKKCDAMGIELLSLPVSSSADAQLVTDALLAKHPSAFFALPDNVIFAAFETILNSCNKAGVPVFTSEAGLVSRGAVASFGADFYKWGYQSGEMAARWLKSDRSALPAPEIVRYRQQWINETAAEKFGIGASTSGSEIKNDRATSFYFTALLIGLALVPLALGIFITLHIFNIPDITTDGSYTLGAAVTAVCIMSRTDPWITLLLTLLSGMLAGSITGMIHTRLKVQPLLSGILVMTALYSVNLMIMGRSNIPLPLESGLLGTASATPFWLLLFVAVAGCGMMWLLRTDFGLAMRATGNSERMVRALGVNTDRMKIAGLAMANGLTAISGFLMAQFQHYSDINMGVGIVISGLAAVMLGESLLRLTRWNSISVAIVSVIAGSILFRLILALVLSFGVDPNYLKLITALMVLVVVALKRTRT